MNDGWHEQLRQATINHTRNAIENFVAKYLISTFVNASQCNLSLSLSHPPPPLPKSLSFFPPSITPYSIQLYLLLDEPFKYSVLYSRQRIWSGTNWTKSWQKRWMWNAFEFAFRRRKTEEKGSFFNRHIKNSLINLNCV